MTSEAQVRAAFAAMAVECERLGSPFTALLLGQAAERLDRSTVIGRRILDWPGIPDAKHDAVPLRLAGGLHALARAGRRPSLALLYPPAALPDADTLWRAAAEAIAAEVEALGAWLDHAPQTNEVARSPILMCGLMAVAAATGGMPIALHELGASGGLNLLLDRYAYRIGDLRFGAEDSPLTITPEWTGPLPPLSHVKLRRRRGVDLNPLDVRREDHRHRLLSYVWPEHDSRIARIEAAIGIARKDPAPVDRGDAADWIEARLGPEDEPGVVRVVMHSIAFQYFPANTQRRILDRIAMLGDRATTEMPFAWLRFELDDESRGASLRLKLWPGGADRKLATGSGHHPIITWIG